jgi:hypothetical protein
MSVRNDIGGAIDLATLHRPQDAEAMLVAIHELRTRGFSDYEIAAATRLSVEYVRRTLGEPRP